VEGLSTVIHVAHAVLAGVWLGGVVFTTTVVSPALKAMKWSESERVLVRSRIGKQYAKVGSVNLALLSLFAALDGLIAGFGPVLYVEYAMLIVVVGLVVAHGAYFGRRLKGLAEAESRANDAGEARALAERRRGLQKKSLNVSWANIVVSLVVAAIAVAV
jgi:putative copper export protein